MRPVRDRTGKPWQNLATLPGLVCDRPAKRSSLLAHGHSDRIHGGTVPGLVRRPLVIWLLAALAVPVLLTAVLIPAKAGTTEDDLHDRTLAALQSRGINGAEVDVHGRDATVA